MTEQIFRFSDEARRRQRRNFLWLSLVQPICIALMMPFAPGVPMSLWERAIMVVFVFLVILLFMYLLDRQLKSTAVTLTEHALLQKTSKRHVRRLAYKDIDQITVHRTAGGQIQRIRVATDEEFVLLIGYEQMELLVDAIIAHMNQPPAVMAKKLRFDWRRPVPIVFLNVALLGGLWLFWQIFDIVDILFFMSVVMIVLAGQLLLRRSLSRGMGRQYRKFEIGTSVVAFGLVVLLYFMLAQVDYLWGQPCSLYERYIQRSGCIWSHTFGSEPVAFLPDDTLVYDGVPDTIYLHQFAKWYDIRPELLPNELILDDMVVSPDGRYLFLWGLLQPWRLWQLDTETFQDGNEKSFLNEAAFSPDGRYLAAAYRDHIQLWTVEPWQPAHTLPGRREIAFSPDAQILATLEADGAIVLLQVDNGREIQRLPLSVDDTIEDMTFAGGGQMLVVAWNESEQIHLLDLAEGQTQIIGRQPAQWAISSKKLALSPDGRYLAIAYFDPRWDGVVEVWDLVGPSLLTVMNVGGGFSHSISMAFSPDGRYLAVGTGIVVSVFDVDRWLGR